MANLIGTAGHVDHGKTTLIRALTGIDTDRLPEEKKRGLTIDVGFAYVDLPEVGRASIVDVPGHERFLTNMLVGAQGIDVALLCVAADESVMPQTVEHFQILELLPVERMVVALTRSDLVDAETLEFARAEVDELLAPTRFKGSPIVAVSAPQGKGLDELKTRLVDAIKARDLEAAGPWYLPIDRVFGVKGHGVVVTGTMAQGEVTEGCQAVLMPEGKSVRVRSIQSHEVASSTSVKGKRTALNLGGVKEEEVRRGQMVGTPGVVFSTKVMDAKVRWLKPVRHSARVRVSVGADEAIARAFLNDEDPALVQLRFERPVAVATGQPVIVRKYSPPTLLGGGRVTVPEATVRRKSEHVMQVDEGLDTEAAVLQAVENTQGGAHTDEVCRAVGKSAQALGDVFESLKSSGRLYGFAGLWMTEGQFRQSSEKYLKALGDLHEANPTVLVQPREAPLKKAGIRWAGKPLDRIITALVERGDLRATGTNVALADFRVKFSDKQRQMLDRVKAELESNGFSPPSTQQIADSLHVPPQAVEEIVRVGVSAGEIVRIEDNIFFSQEMLDKIVERLNETFTGKSFTASEFREAMETSRKYAIPLLESLDSKGVTKRMGDSRVLVGR
ncbi:MAG TPA: selenocysteine-specific translation elongation factor [Fimbriimonadaceae bacterium]|nr:selenocysteine-specific translation elongation factor [Fimbriimonadaceae bacterium]